MKPLFSADTLNPGVRQREVFGAPLMQMQNTRFKLAEVQAEPDDTAKPLMPMISDSPST